MVGAFESCKMKPCSIPSNKYSASGSSDINCFHTCNRSVRLGKGGGRGVVVVGVGGLLVVLLEGGSSFAGRFLHGDVWCRGEDPGMSCKHVRSGMRLWYTCFY